MKFYLDLVLKKEKRAISYEDIIEKIEKIISLEKDASVRLNEDEKSELSALLEAAVESYDVYKTPKNTYISILKTNYRKGTFYAT